MAELIAELIKMGKGGMATGKRNKEGRKRRKEQERIEYLDHQKRRLENYIKAEVSFSPHAKCIVSSNRKIAMKSIWMLQIQI